MNKKTLTKALAINVVVLVLVVALLGGLTFAWFSTRQTADTTQVIQVGNFAINLNDTTKEYLQSKNIEFSKAFPSTRDVANADDTAVTDGTANYDYLTGNKFAFSVSNKGDIDALFGFDVVVNGANNANLEKAMRFDVYKQAEDGTKIFNEIKYNLSNTNELTTIDALKTQLLTAVGEEQVPTSSENTKLVESGLAKIAAGAKEIELLIVAWIDPSATYGDGADDVKVGDTFEFAVQMAAIQAVGGITKADIDNAKIFDNMPPQEWKTFFTSSDNVDTGVSFTKEYTYKYTMNGIGVDPYLDNAKAGDKYGNKIVINLNNASITAKTAVWTVAAEGDSTVTADDIQASVNGNVVKGLDNIKAELDNISLSAGVNTEITIIIWTENVADQANVIFLKFTAGNTVAP